MSDSMMPLAIVDPFSLVWCTTHSYQCCERSYPDFGH